MRKELIFLIVLAIFVVLLAGAVKVFQNTSSQDDARRFVLSDLQQKYPAADTEILDIQEKSNSQNEKYFYIKARVTNAAATACPERIHVYYNYPEQNFAATPPEYITRSCSVCISGSSCVLAFPEEAVIASHTLPGSEPITTFLGAFGSAYPLVQETASGWKVTWDSPASAYYYTLEVGHNARLSNVQKIGKKNNVSG